MLLAISETAWIGICVAILSLTAATVTAMFTLKGKKVDAGEWIVDELRTDAEVSRQKIEKTQEEFDKFRNSAELEMKLLRKAVVDLRDKERELISYINILQNEMETFRELYFSAVGSTPDINFYQIDPNSLSYSKPTFEHSDPDHPDNLSFS